MREPEGLPSRGGSAYRSAARNERAWLYGVARHVVSAEYRRKNRLDVLNSRVAGRRLLGADDIARVEDRIVAEKEGRAMVEAMEGLPEQQRAVLELVAVDQLTVAEAARALGIRSVSARVTLHRARAHLRKAAGAPSDESASAAPLTRSTAAVLDASAASIDLSRSRA
ncbi:RNA polymerase sigma factor [Streptomyces sp. NBC_00448]|uniref:RNA polymerase sigma factor n=1 Tax=Streptomyces sp. NBC_00448 TaxID=2903652 RepID=UPI002E1DD923